MVTKNLHWLAGFLEGEGSFEIDKRRMAPVVRVCGTDKDTIFRAALLLGHPMGGPYLYGTSKKPVWRVASYGSRAAGWMMTLYSLMGERRKAKIREVLGLWKQSNTQRNPFRKRTPNQKGTL